MPEYDDYPFDDVVASADRAIKAGGNVYFKFTCRGCGARQTFDVPNVAYETGTCEECGVVTDIRKAGMNFMVHFGALPQRKETSP